MSWAKIDDRANEHEKQLAAGAKACWLWACGLMYANRQTRKTGRIPKTVVGILFPGLGKREARKLVEVGLWHDDGDAYLIHQYSGWNPELREKRAEAGRKGGKRSGEARREANAKQSASPDESNDEANARSNPAGARVARGIHPTPPHPERSDQKTTTQDLTGSPRDEPPEQQPHQKTRCPSDLQLDEETLAGWQMNPGIPPDLARFAVRQWAAGQHADPDDRRHLGAWLKCAAKAVLGTWSDAKRREQLRREFEASKQGPTGRGKRTQAEIDHQARLAAQAEARKRARDAEVLAQYGPKVADTKTPDKAAERPNPGRARELARGIGRPD